MSISYNVYFRELKPMALEELAARCRNLDWVVLMRDRSAPPGAEKFMKPTGFLADGDCFYGADARRVSESELEAALLEERWDVLWNTSGGEAIVSINADFDIHEIYDDDGLRELSETNAALVDRLGNAKVQIEFLGGAHFVLELSDALARMGGGAWEDPQAGDWELT
jgi:hypothetical protein